MTMTKLEAEIAKAKKQANDRIRKLKREAAAEQRKIDERVIELLREQDPDRYGQLVAQATGILTAARAKRPNNARRAVPGSADSAAASGITHITDKRELEAS